MLIKIHTRGFALSDALNDYTDAKLRLALGLYPEKIRRVDVFLCDVNGPRGGEDMRCKMQIKADGFPIVVVHETADDLYDAINICAHRLKRAMRRRFDRLVQRRKVGSSFVQVPDADEGLSLAQY